MFLKIMALSLALQFTDTVTVVESMCAGCSIRMERVATLGEEDGPGMLTSQAVVAIDMQGRYLVAHMGDGARIKVFSPSGAFVRNIGRAGSGPGEYRRIWRIAPFAGGVIVYDDVAKRSTRLSRELTFIETRPAPETPLSVVLRDDGAGVMSALVPSRDLVGYPLHEFDAKGRRLRSFGFPGITYRRDLRELFERYLTPSAEPNRFWASHSAEYAFAKCSIGRPNDCRLFVRPAPWFPRPKPSELNRQVLEKAPAPALWGVSQDGARYLWTMTRVADRRWRTVVDEPLPDHLEIADWHQYVDTVVECIDLTTNRVVASQRFDEALLRFIGPGTAWYANEDSSGVERVQVVRFRLNESSP